MDKVVDSIPISAIPASSLQSYYCTLSSLSSESLFEYSQIMILANGECNWDSVSCSSSGILSIYNDAACLTLNETFHLNSANSMTNTILGPVTASYSQLTLVSYEN